MPRVELPLGYQRIRFDQLGDSLHTRLHGALRRLGHSRPGGAVLATRAGGKALRGRHREFVLLVFRVRDMGAAVSAGVLQSALGTMTNTRLESEVEKSGSKREVARHWFVVVGPPLAAFAQQQVSYGM